MCIRDSVPSISHASYSASGPDNALRAYLDQVRAAVDGGHTGLVDVRSPAEFTGEILAPPGLPETCQRGGHIPGARSIPWGKACNEAVSYTHLDVYKRQPTSWPKPTKPWRVR